MARKRGKKPPTKHRVRDAAACANRFAGGGIETRQNRASQARLVFEEIERVTRVNNPHHLCRKHIVKLVAYWNTEQTIGPGTQKARLGALRAALSGMHIDPEPILGGISVSGVNAALGVPPRDHAGAHTATTIDDFERCLAAAQANPRKRRVFDQGMIIAAKFNYVMGLRIKEATCIDLPSMEAALRKRTGELVIPVTRGTKKRILRDVKPYSDEHLEQIRAVIAEARAYLGPKGGYLVKSKSLQGARRRLSRFWKDLQLPNDETSHSGRYDFSQQAVKARRESGDHDNVALGRTSNDLGHGAARGVRLLKQVYLNNKADRQKK